MIRSCSRLLCANLFAVCASVSFRDYEEHPELDVLDPEMLDNRQFEPITRAQRFAAEREIERRHQEEAARAKELRQQQQSDADRMSWLQRIPASLLMTEREQEEEEMRARRAELDGLNEIAVEDSLGGDGSGAQARGGLREQRRKRKRLVYEDEGDDQERADEEGAESAVVLGAEELQHLEEEDDQPVEEGLERIPGTKLADWLALAGPREEVSRRFRRFLWGFREESLPAEDGADEDGGEGAAGKKRAPAAPRAPLYQRRISSMCSANRTSLIVDFSHLSFAEPDIAAWCIDEPRAVLPVLDEAAKKITLRLFPEYRHIIGVGDTRSQRTGAIHVRFTNIPETDRIPDLRQQHLNKLVKVVGVVTRRTSVLPQLVTVWFKCVACNSSFGPFATTDTQIPSMPLCPRCQSRGSCVVSTEKTVFRNYQCMTLQESPSMVKPGRLPRSKDIIVLDDLVDSAKPGEEVEIVGIYRHMYDMNLHRSHGFPVFATMIEANNVTKREDSIASFKLTPEDEHQVRMLASDERILERVAASIAPSIFGHSDIKMALALALFGGQTRILVDQGQHRIRGDINVLLLGDPGTAKSQFLKFVEKNFTSCSFHHRKGQHSRGPYRSCKQRPNYP